MQDQTEEKIKYYYQGTTKLDVPEGVRAIRSDEQLLKAFSGKVPKKLRIDWSKDVLLLVYLGERRTGGHSVGIVGVSKFPFFSENVIVAYRETVPSKPKHTQVLEYPGCAMIYPKFSGDPVGFTTGPDKGLLHLTSGGEVPFPFFTHPTMEELAK